MRHSVPALRNAAACTHSLVCRHMLRVVLQMPVSRQHQLHPATQQHRWHSPSLPFKRVVRRCSRLAASAWGAPEPFLPAPSLSSIAEMQQQLDRELDSAFMAPFSSMRRFEDRMDQQFREMDRQMDRAFADMDRSAVRSCLQSSAAEWLLGSPLQQSVSQLLGSMLQCCGSCVTACAVCILLQ